MTTEPVQLTCLADGDAAQLHLTTLDPDTRALLRSLGLTDDSTLRVCKSGEPFIFQVRDTRIGVSSAVAARILVVVNRNAARVDDAHAGQLALT